jgi:hypothetical protein
MPIKKVLNTSRDGTKTPDASSDLSEMHLETTVKCNREPKCARVSHRDIAKMLVYAMPIKFSPDEFLQCVEDNIKAIQDMPKESRIALKMGYLFSSRVPRDEREDFMQELSLKLIELKCPDEKLAYTIARCDWVDWWRRYAKKEATYTSLEAMLETREGEGQNEAILADLTTGAMEYETREDCKAKRILDAMSQTEAGKRMLMIGAKRLQGLALTHAERQALCSWISRNALYYLTNP